MALFQEVIHRTPFVSILYQRRAENIELVWSVDNRNLNATSVLESYPISHLHSMTNNLFGSKIFSLLDIKSAYFNVPI